MKKNLIIFGTRPEAIKMAPLVHEFKKNQIDFETKVCVTAQHREMLDQVLEFFEVEVDYDLNLMRPNQSLHTLTADIVKELKPILEEYDPDYVYVHGDTTTTMVASIAAFYSGIIVCHVEAGLRTFDKYSPFPEEINRVLTSKIANYHFAPTEQAKINLLNENILGEDVLVTGNSVIDALMMSVKKIKEVDDIEISELKKIIKNDKKLILITGHRRENHGQVLVDICEALKEIAIRNSDVQLVYPVHMNPKVRGTVYKILSEIENISLINPLAYPAFVWLMQKSYLIITDSGGIQEEAPSLGKPVLVMRETTERPEAVNAGTVILVGTSKEKIVNKCQLLLENASEYKKMSMLHNPYGDGNACKKIVNFIQQVERKNDS